MAYVVVQHRPVTQVPRRKPDDVLGIVSGPSRRGSTYWGRALHCPFEHYLGNVLGWQSEAPSDPLDTGTIWHYAKEQYYRNARAWQQACRAQDPNLNPRDPHFLRGHDSDSQLIAFRAIRPFASEPGYDHIYPKLEAMLEAYFARWSRTDMFEILGVELTVESDGRYGFEWSNKLDLLVIDYRGPEAVLRIVEHKSTYRMDSYVLEGYTQDLQTMGQVWLFYGATDGTLHRVLGESGFEHLPPFLGSYVNLTSKTKNPACERVVLAPAPLMLRAWERSMQKNALLLGLYEDVGYPRNYTACSRRYGHCEFFAFCRAFPQVEAREAWEMTANDDLPPTYKRRLPVITDDLEGQGT